MVSLPIAHAFALMVVLAANEPPWEQAAQTDGITVFTRAKPGSNVREVKATALLPFTPLQVWGFLRNYPEYKNTMPYTKESVVLARENDGKTVFLYSVIDAPMVSMRDFVLKIVDVSDWKDGAGYLKASWTTTTEHTVAESRRKVRVKINDGHWLLEPKDGGKATQATYYLYTDPAGAIPNFIVNKANTSAIPDIFRAIRKNLSKAP